jgi:anhydro-N-acetylmuramic acid kinase
VAKLRTALGLMSGTSLDGIDVALLSTDGERIAEFGPARTYGYSEADRRVLRRALEEAQALTAREARPAALEEAETLVTLRHARAVDDFLAETGVARDSVDLVGFHGQTVFHDPARRLTVQIGDGQALAERLGRPVVWDFRAEDVAAGGQGAPFVPAYHRALAATAGAELPVVFVNIGGVANVTYVGADGELIAFDTGPGNALLDDLVAARTGEAFDADGRLAAAGTPDAAVIERLLAHPYFALPPPKSLDRQSFAAGDMGGLSDADAAATLLAFTARSIAAAAAHFPQPARAWYVCGGGRRNGELMRVLRGSLGAPVEPLEALGFDGDATEAQAFAFLAVRAMDGKPLSYPKTTGVPTPLSGGIVTRPASG